MSCSFKVLPEGLNWHKRDSREKIRFNSVCVGNPYRHWNSKDRQNEVYQRNALCRVIRKSDVW